MLNLWLKDNVGYEIFNPDLSVLLKVMSHLNLDFEDKKIITIAGTNGKGETSRILYHQLKSHCNLTLWTSPHILCPTERIKDKRGNVDKDKFLVKAIELNKFLKSNSYRLSYFEFIFILYLQFSIDADVLIMEVGLGGRLDATNALAANIVLLTSISRDHQQILGSTYRKIISEKLGVVRVNSILISTLELSYLRNLAKKTPCKTYIDLFDQKLLDLNDNFHVRNMALATKCLEALGYKANKIDYSSQEFFNKWYKFEGADVYLNSAHNPDGVRKLVQFSRNDEYNYQRILLSLSSREYSDAITMLKSLKTLGLPIALTHFDHLKAMDKIIIKKIATECECEFIQDLTLFFKQASRTEENILCLGSNFFLADLITRFQGR